MLDVLAPPRAVFSPDGVYRYRIERTWDARLQAAVCIGVNPSRAGQGEFFGRPSKGDDLDPTCRREIAMLKRRLGIGAWLKGNLFALVSTDPLALRTAVDPIGPENDAHLVAMIRCARMIVCCWGNGVKLASPDGQRACDVMRMIRENAQAGVVPLCFRVTKEQHVEHSLYQKADAVLMPVPEDLYG